VAEPAAIPRTGIERRAPALSRARSRQWRRYWLWDPLLGGLDFAIHHLARRLPIGCCSALGGRLGVLNGRYRFAAVRERVRRGYTQLSRERLEPGDADRAVMRFFDHVGRVMTEFSVLDRLWAAGRIAVVGAEHLLAARAAGRPLIVMGLHLGNWEVIGPSLIGLGLRFKFIYQPPRSRFEHRIAVAARQRYGAVLLRPGIAAARTAHRLLVEEKGTLLIYADDERRGYVNAPLFGRPVAPRANLRNIARLAAASRAAVIPAYAERLDGAHARVTFLAPVELTEALLDNVQRLDRVITPPVLARLDQWYMLVDYHQA
jgi:KDO2-lipid IV(A) lauroyltransferase